MSNDIQNKLFGVMHSEMVPPQPDFVPKFEVGGCATIFDQMDAALDRSVVQRHAMLATKLLSGVVDQDPVTLESTVRDFSSIKLVQGITVSDPDTITLAIASAAIVLATSQGHQTAMEKIEGAVAVLSARYQADW